MKRIAQRNPFDQHGGPIIRLDDGPGDLPDDGFVVVGQGPAQGKSKHAFGHRPGEGFLAAQQNVLEFGRAVEALAIGQLANRVEGPAVLVRQAPAADGVVVLEPVPDRVDAIMAGGALRGFAVLLEALPKGEAFRCRGRLGQVARVGRGRRQFHAQQRLEHPFPPQHRACPHRQRGRRQQTRHADDTASVAVLNGDLAELPSDDTADSVVRRQFLVHREVLGVDELEQTAVLPQQAAEELDDFPLHRLLERTAVLGEDAGVRFRAAAQFHRAEPLADESARKSDRPGVTDHAADLVPDDAGLTETPFLRQIEQGFVRHGEPEKVREPRSESVAADSPFRAAALFEPEEEVRRHESGLERTADGLIEGQALPIGLLEELEQVLRLLRVNRPAPGAGGEPPEDAGGRFLLRGSGIGLGDENTGTVGELGRFLFDPDPIERENDLRFLDLGLLVASSFGFLSLAADDREKLLLLVVGDGGLLDVAVQREAVIAGGNPAAQRVDLRLFLRRGDHFAGHDAVRHANGDAGHPAFRARAPPAPHPEAVPAAAGELHIAVDGLLEVVEVEAVVEHRMIHFGAVHRLDFNASAERFRPAAGRDEGSDDFMGGLEVFLHQQRRDEQAGPVVVEPGVAGAVGRKMAGGPKVQAGQVTDRVVVLRAVEAGDDGMAGVADLRPVDVPQSFVGPVGHRDALGLLREGGRGRHFPLPQDAQDAQPDIAALRGIALRADRPEVDAGGSRLRAVAANAIGLQNRLHVLLKIQRGVIGEGRPSGQQQRGENGLPGQRLPSLTRGRIHGLPGKRSTPFIMAECGSCQLLVFSF